MKKWQYLTSTALLGSAIVLGACGGEENNDETATSAQTTEQAEAGSAQLTGNVVGDGSSTVAPITEALVEEYAGYKRCTRRSWCIWYRRRFRKIHQW